MNYSDYMPVRIRSKLECIHQMKSKIVFHLHRIVLLYVKDEEDRNGVNMAGFTNCLLWPTNRS